VLRLLVINKKMTTCRAMTHHFCCWIKTPLIIFSKDREIIRYIFFFVSSVLFLSLTHNKQTKFQHKLCNQKIYWVTITNSIILKKNETLSLSKRKKNDKNFIPIYSFSMFYLFINNTKKKTRKISTVQMIKIDT
jgi:flagellin-specific chaperone FliS